MEFYLSPVTSLKIFSYLDAFSLLQAAQVNKDWNAIASSDILWKKFCVKRWLFCDLVTLQLLGTETWKQFFVYQTWQEHIKSRARPEDFTYKEIYVEPGTHGYACYLSGRGLTRIRQDRSVVCILSSRAKISTWDIHEGVMTWVSPEQPTYIKMLTTLPEMHIAVTVDIEQTIKLWDCHKTEALATNRLLFPCESLEAVFTKDGPIVLAGDTGGDLYIFRIPDLHLISKVHVFQYGINQLYCSPQRKWVFVSKKHPHISPQVYFLSSLLRTSEFSAPVSTILSFSLCQGACWTPRREDRITLMARRGPKQATKFSTFDMKLEEIGNQLTVKGYLVAYFVFQDYGEFPEWMGVSDKNVIVCSTVSSLLLFSMEGNHLQRFQYYPEEILRLWVDPVYVIVTFLDGSLDVYAWEERSLRLRRCYRLPNFRYLPQSSYANTKTLCDNVSIIRMMTNGTAPNYLMAYTLNIFS
ncbi:F-box/WD repeat-containing protein 15-like isoform X1 [Arvicanthis niloticus]|uniref:F-box/WD repeat-containing protein 15-like isoform X1 n=1 Tax=Arvicanthis niloticus TaxID=61156 RepID=UPI001485E65E|nr:F-box/WD repeat-containing protein 15-like isoform X5 [Arvicanthis niloticus]